MIRYSPADRYAVLGTSGTGKTVFMTVLACLLVPPTSTDWQCWWANTKDDPADMKRLAEWGFVAPGKGPRQVYNMRGDTAYEQAQDLANRALETRGVLLVYDEYAHVVRNTIDAGPGIRDVHKTGRGIDVGMIGGVQEPAYTPRQLFSQAIHRAIFGLEHLPDIKVARELNHKYAQGWPEETDRTVPDVHGFWLRSNPQAGDDNSWHYWPHVGRWRDHVAA